MWKIAQRIAVAMAAVLGVLAIGVLLTIYSFRITTKENCPILAWFHPVDRSPIRADDFIELQAGGGLITWEPIQIRIYANGRIERDTVSTDRAGNVGCPLENKDKVTHISSSTATKLIIRAREGGFCRLCRTYHFPRTINDAGSATLTLSLNKQTKSVWNHAGKPPPLFDELAGTIAALSPMENLADTRKFTPERTKRCEEVTEQQNQQWKDWQSQHLSGGGK